MIMKTMLSRHRKLAFGAALGDAWLVVTGLARCFESAGLAATLIYADIDQALVCSIWMGFRVGDSHSMWIHDTHGGDWAG